MADDIFDAILAQKLRLCVKAEVDGADGACFLEVEDDGNDAEVRLFEGRCALGDLGRNDLKQRVSFQAVCLRM